MQSSSTSPSHQSEAPEQYSPFGTSLLERKVPGSDKAIHTEMVPVRNPCSQETRSVVAMSQVLVLKKGFAFYINVWIYSKNVAYVQKGRKTFT